MPPSRLIGQSPGAVPCLQKRSIDEDPRRHSIVNIGSIAPSACPRLTYSVSSGLMTMTKNAAAARPLPHPLNQLNVGWTLTEGKRRFSSPTARF
jgi:hypothetical protein